MRMAIALLEHIKIKIYIHSQPIALVQLYTLTRRISSLGFHTILGGLPRLAAGDFIEPPRNILSLIPLHGKL